MRRIEPPLSVDRINTVLYCRRWRETVAFYQDVIGFPVETQNDWFVEFGVAEHAFLSVADAGRATIEPVEGRGITLTMHTSDLTAAWSRLDGSAHAPMPITRRWGADVFYCHDPEGHRIEFWSEPGDTAP